MDQLLGFMEGKQLHNRLRILKTYDNNLKLQIVDTSSSHNGKVKAEVELNLLDRFRLRKILKEM